ncbi:hypothetical protein [Coralloluteibacterium thermophilus]|uniref:hypothetical protein n=1 Tax=Coralloluteibacterium thermophilum TaxID=2707049 RepID=UPI0036721A68
MRSDPVARKWQRTILGKCEDALGRSLTEVEARFITSRGSYLALEAIDDHVASLVSQPEELAAFLNSEA